jgi:hypothetical protein
LSSEFWILLHIAYGIFKLSFGKDATAIAQRLEKINLKDKSGIPHFKLSHIHNSKNITK